MDLSTITVSDFKGLFQRDFPFLPTWEAGGIYNTGAVVYYPLTQLFYVSEVDGNLLPPSDLSQWDEKPADINDYIADSDIIRAMLEAEMMFNQSIWGEDRFVRMGFLYLTANYLVNDARARSNAFAGPSYTVSSRTVGNVSETYAIPKSYTDNPAYAFLTQTPYGMKYLQMLIPNLAGNFAVVGGGTTP